jgi:hypothetical protein
MELDDYKDKWQKDTAYQSHIPEKNMEQIQAILHEKTSAILLDVKKRYESAISIILIGLLGNLVVSPFLPWLLGVEGPIFRIPTELGSLLSLVVILTVGILIVFFFWLKYTATQTLIKTDNLKLALSQNIERFKRSRRHEIYFFIALYIVLFIAGRSQSQLLGYGDFWDIFKRDIMLALLILLLGIGYYLFYKIKLYNKNIRELQKYLSEFDESFK